MTAVQPIPIPLFSPIANRDATLTKDSRLINGFVEKGQGDEGRDTWVYKRPGLKVYSTYGAGAGRGIFNWNGDIYAVFGTTLYKNGSSIGTVDGTSSYTFTSCLGATPKLTLKNKAAAYNYSTGTGLVKVTDVNYPATTVRGCEYLDGTTYVMDSAANIHGSAFNDPTTWDPLNKLVAQIEPDAGQCLAKQLVYIIAIKTISTEVFYDAGNATGSPLGAVQGSKLGVGARSPESVVRMGDDLAWIGTTNEGAVQVILMSRVHGEPISTTPVERFLAGIDYTTIYAWGAKISGHRYYAVTSVVSNITLVFDLTVGTWYIWQDPNGNYFPIVSSTYDANANALLQHESNGKVYTLDTNTYQDDLSNFTLKLYTPNFDGGVRTKKTCSTISVIGDEIATTVNVSWSDDDYQTFSTALPADMSSDNPIVQDGAAFRKRAFLLTHTDNTFLRIKGLNINSSASGTI